MKRNEIIYLFDNQCAIDNQYNVFNIERQHAGQVFKQVTCIAALFSARHLMNSVVHRPFIHAQHTSTNPVRGRRIGQGQANGIRLDVRDWRGQGTSAGQGKHKHDNHG